MSENCSTEDNRAGSSSENTEEAKPAFRTLTKEAVPPHKTAGGIDPAGSSDGGNTALEPLPQDWLQCHFWRSRISARHKYWRKSLQYTNN